jgi:hypothetical protein
MRKQKQILDHRYIKVSMYNYLKLYVDNFKSSFCNGILNCECFKEKKYYTPYQKIYQQGSE